MCHIGRVPAATVHTIAVVERKGGMSDGEEEMEKLMCLMVRLERGAAGP